MNNKFNHSSSSGTFKFFSDDLDQDKVKHLENILSIAANGDNESFYSYEENNLVIYIFEDEQCKKKNVETALKKLMNEFKNDIVSLDFCIKEEEKNINNNENYHSYSGTITTKYFYENESDNGIIVTVITNSTSSRTF